MPLPALVLSEGAWTRVTAAAAPTGSVVTSFPLVAVNGKVAQELPALDVVGPLDLPVASLRPTSSLDELRSAVKVGAMPPGAVAYGPAGDTHALDVEAVAPLVEAHPTVVMAMAERVFPCRTPRPIR